jgi:beta-glucosidase
MSNGSTSYPRFPEGFLWGVATSAHQIEGGNVNNDWWRWEHDPTSGCAESSADACDSFNRWPEDVDLVSSFGLGAYRFSLEWSRIEPAEGEFSMAALDHYRRICATCHEKGLSPVVTFHHFTTPLWLSSRGAWESPDAPDRFGRFVERTTAHIGDLVSWACTINEPNVIGVMGYTKGDYPPGAKDELGRHVAVNEQMVKAHRRAVDALRSGPGSFPVGLTLSMAELNAQEGGETIRDAAEEILENTFLRACEGDDFVGVQAYTRINLGPEGELPGEPGVRVTQMGYEWWPQVVEYTVRRAADFTKVPVLVTENGIGTEDDAERIEYVHGALQGLLRCIDDGVDVRGYFVWSLLDNFEWNLGYGPKFGIVEVDRTTFERKPKPSAWWFSEVARSNSLVAPK